VKIGIDVGGTNTDAVLMDGERVVVEVKHSTTPDVTAGVVAALRDLVQRSEVPPARVEAVMIGTTHFTNAVVEGKRLLPTAVIRLGLPATRALPPMVDWPARLREALGKHVYLCRGGHEYDGRVIAPLEPEELKRALADIAAKGIRTIAVSSVFSPVNNEFEVEAAALITAQLPHVSVSLSHQIGRLGLLERENAAIMNACLHDLAVQIVGAFKTALHEIGIEAPLYLSQNDGTLMSVDYAERYPVFTFASGPTNSMRGAALLSGVRDCAVVDIGGTTTDVGILQDGFPREASVGVEIGGIRTNFRMPDLLSVGIGGGSHIQAGPPMQIGPDSVGYELEQRAVVFGGQDLTASDLAVAAGLASFGDPSLASRLDPSLVREGLASIRDRVAVAVDRMKTSSEQLPVILVGGGSILLADGLEGASDVIRPDHFAVANAIGAAIAQVGGEVERVFSLDDITREAALERSKAEAVAKATAAGADPSTVRIMDVEDVPLVYLPGNATRIKVKAVGDLTLRGELVATG
jgi:N-methylhydantoinase A/oxoprolinase/acetone carboxylase beta subunit